jgi:hypothetical protein
MAFEAWWHEDFFEWAAASNIASFSGTGWSASSASSPNCVADADFASGKCIEWTAAMANNAAYAFPTLPGGVLATLSFNFKRRVDCNATPTANAGQGWRFLTGIGDHYIQICWGSVGDGLQNTLYLVSRTGATGTFQVLRQSENKYLQGVKYPMALTMDWTAGQFQWIVNGEILFSGVVADLAGLSAVGVQYGRLATAAGTGECRAGDFYLYTDSFYIGPVEIRSGFPTADEALQDWSFVGGASAWECLNNFLSLAPAQYIESATLGDVSQFTCPVNNTNVFQVYSGELRFYGVRTDVSPVDMESQYGDSVSVAASPTFNPNQGAYQYLKWFWNGINPNTGIAWQLADLPASVIGFERTS